MIKTFSKHPDIALLYAKPGQTESFIRLENFVREDETLRSGCNCNYYFGLPCEFCCVKLKHYRISDKTFPNPRDNSTTEQAINATPEPIGLDVSAERDGTTGVIEWTHQHRNHFDTGNRKPAHCVPAIHRVQKGNYGT